MTCFGKEDFHKGNDWRVWVKKELESYEGIYKVRVTNPNDYFNFLVTDYDSEREVQEFDLERIRHSDLIIVNFNTEVSIGTSKELAIANEYKIPVIGLNECGIKMHPWDINDCRRIFDEMYKMLEYVKRFYLT